MFRGEASSLPRLTPVSRLTWLNMSGIHQCAALVVVAFMVASASAQEAEIPPPPDPESEVRVEIAPDPELAQSAASHLDRYATEPAPSFQDALREENREAALLAIPLGRTPVLACLEAMLLEERVRVFYVPPLDGDALTERVVRVQAAALVPVIQPVRFAYARCLATIERAPQLTEHEQAFRERAEELERTRALAQSEDPLAAHPAMLALVESAPEPTWAELTALYEESHGSVRPDPDEEHLEGWQSGAVITTSLLFGGALISMVVGIRIERVETGRYMLGALGVMVGTFPGLMLGRTWSNPESEWTPHRLMAGAILTVGSIAGGIALFRADMKRRHQIFGATLAGSAVGNLIWLVGGLGVYRRQRRGLRGRPTVEIARGYGGIGWSGSF